MAVYSSFFGRSSETVESRFGLRKTASQWCIFWEKLRFPIVKITSKRLKIISVHVSFCFHFHSVENDKKYNGLMDKVNTYVKVNHQGLHTWNAAVTLRMGCGMNIENYPFDTQKCPLRFGSLSMDATRMQLVPKKINTKSYGGKWWAFLKSPWIFYFVQLSSTWEDVI